MLERCTVRTLAVVALLAAACGAPPVEIPEARDLDGRTVPALAADAVTVLLFTRTDCPISNRYAPEVRRVHEEYAGRGVELRLVYVDPDQDADAIRRHLDEYEYDLPALLDGDHELVALAGATVTPEAAVFDRDGTLVYRGRIDDRYVDFGTARAEPTRRDLRLALDAVLAGREVETPTTRAVGCFIADLE